MSVSRRLFLKAAALCVSSRVTTGFATKQLSSASEELTRHLLDLVNGARASAGFSRLVIDDLAASVAQKHATEMLAGRFLSHWGRDGRKPYHRYSFAGGFDAVEENISEV